MIPFLDLQAQYRLLGPEIESAALKVLRGGDYVLGRAVQEFEAAFAAFCGTQHAVSVNTGTSALHLALLAAGIGPGDEVITVPMTFVATVAAIEYAGATPVLVDIDPVTWTLDPSKIEQALTPRTKAIMPVHLHGRLANMPAIMEVARRHGILVIEDAAQAHGATLDGLRAGAVGDIGCFSFYPGKNLGACGEGGAIVTNRADFADEIRCLRDWGQAGRYNHVRKGFNFRLDTVQAAILDVKLKHVEAWSEARRRNAAAYDELLDANGIARPASAGPEHVYHVYAVRVENRDHVRAKLAELNIATGIHYPRPVHLQPAYRDLGYENGRFPVAEKLAAETLSLPLYPELKREQIEQVVGALVRACASPVAVAA